MPQVLYGLKNCDSCRKACRWLSDQGLEVTLHDLRTDGMPPALLDEWLESLGMDNLLNRRSTTWRQLDPKLRENLKPETARSLLLEHPSLIKRPLIQINGQWIQGFSEALYTTVLAGAD